MSAVPAAPPARPPRRRPRLATLVAGAVALGVAALAVVAIVRKVAGAHGPVLPYGLCRTGGTAHVLPPLSGARFFTSWQWSPLTLVVVGAAGLCYALGLSRYRQRRAQDTAPWPAWRAVSYFLGLGFVVLAVCSAMGVYDMELFSAHMVQHLTLIMVAPTLLVLGRPLTLYVASRDAAGRARAERRLQSRLAVLVTSPGVALAFYTAVIVGAHLTGLTDAILGSAWSGEIEHLVYLVSGLLFFALVFGDEPIPWRLSMPGRLLLLMMAMAVDTFVGVVLLMSSTPVATTLHSWGPSPLDDTQMGGAIMWSGGDGLMAVLAIGLYASWARRPESARRTSSVFERARAGLAAERHAMTDPPRSVPAGAGAAAPSPTAIDEDEREWEAYNRWLAELHRRG